MRQLTALCDGALRAVMLLYVILDQLLELLRNSLAFKNHGPLAVDVHRCDRGFAGAGQADADVGVLALAGAVDDATHHRHGHVFHAVILCPPHGHPLAQVRLDIARQPLEIVRGRAPAAGAGHHHGRERTQPHGLQDFLRDDYLARPIAAAVSYTHLTLPT